MRRLAGHIGGVRAVGFTRTYGRFEQRVTLPCPEDADEVEARLASGVLSVTVPKSETG